MKNISFIVVFLLLGLANTSNASEMSTSSYKTFSIVFSKNSMPKFKSKEAKIEYAKLICEFYNDKVGDDMPICSNIERDLNLTINSKQNTITANTEVKIEFIYKGDRILFIYKKTGKEGAAMTAIGHSHTLVEAMKSFRGDMNIEIN